MDINNGKLYDETDMSFIDQLKGLMDSQTSGIVPLTEEETKSLSSAEVKNRQATKKTMRKIRKRIAKQFRGGA